MALFDHGSFWKPLWTITVTTTYRPSLSALLLCLGVQLSYFSTTSGGQLMAPSALTEFSRGRSEKEDGFAREVSLRYRSTVRFPFSSFETLRQGIGLQISLVQSELVGCLWVTMKYLQFPPGNI